MKTLFNMLITAGLILLIDHFMSDIYVANYMTAFVVSVLLGVLSLFIKPFIAWLLSIIPIHLHNSKSLIFLALILIGAILMTTDAALLSLCSKFNSGVVVDSFWSAFFFSIVLYILEFVADVVLAFLRSAVYVILRLDRFKE